MYHVVVWHDGPDREDVAVEPTVAPPLGLQVRGLELHCRRLTVAPPPSPLVLSLTNSKQGIQDGIHQTSTSREVGNPISLPLHCGGETDRRAHGHRTPATPPPRAHSRRPPAILPPRR